MAVGIEALNFFGGVATVDVRAIFEARGLDTRRFDNLLLTQKSVGLPCEDPVTHAVNAARPLLEQMTPAERERIELLITATESGLDFGNALGTYVHAHLGLSSRCRVLEVKQACYAGTGAFQLAAGLVASGAFPGARALVIATDTARAALRSTYAEPAQAVGAAALLVSDRPTVLELDLGASGLHCAELMDGFRPAPDLELGDADLSLLSYLDSLEACFRMYRDRVEGADFVETFDRLCFHTPFPGMVKGAHRKMMRHWAKASPGAVEDDFQRRVAPSLTYGSVVGNTYSASLYLALASLLDNASIGEFERVGMYSYGSGSTAEMYSGVVTSASAAKVSAMEIGASLERRMKLDLPTYDELLDAGREWMFGVKDKTVDLRPFGDIYDATYAGRGLLVLDRVSSYHREYRWS